MRAWGLGADRSLDRLVLIEQLLPDLVAGRGDSRFRDPCFRESGLWVFRLRGWDHPVDDLGLVLRVALEVPELDHLLALCKAASPIFSLATVWDNMEVLSK